MGNQENTVPDKAESTVHPTVLMWRWTYHSRKTNFILEEFGSRPPWKAGI
jgi:hypothetical protein